MIEKILERLEKTKRTGEGRYKALCPCHHEKTPSLSIQDKGEAIVMFCFGCGANGGDVMQALGLPVHMLFGTEQDQRDNRKTKVDLRTALATLTTELTIMTIAASDLKKGTKLTEPDFDRLKIACDKVLNISCYFKI